MVHARSERQDFRPRRELPAGVGSKAVGMNIRLVEVLFVAVGGRHKCEEPCPAAEAPVPELHLVDRLAGHGVDRRHEAQPFCRRALDE